ncbi:hypothetical protein [Chondromyces crocatus]|nr:hypothetical protein [Chondromyces crocatus]
MKQSKRAAAKAPTPPDAATFLAETEQIANELSWPFESFGEINDFTVASGALIATDPTYEKLIWSYDTDTTIATCMLVARDAVTPARQSAVLKLCALVNDGLSFGCLDFALDDGTLALRDHADLHFGPLDQVLRRATGRLLSVAQQLAPALRGTLTGKKPEAALLDAQQAEEEAAEQDATEEVPASPAPTSKKTASKSTASKSTPAVKPAPRKPASKSTPAVKPAPRKPASKSTPVTKSAPQKPASKAPASSQAAETKATPRKPASKAPPSKSVVATKATPRKTTSKTAPKTEASKPAAAAKATPREAASKTTSSKTTSAAKGTSRKAAPVSKATPPGSAKVTKASPAKSAAPRAASPQKSPTPPKATTSNKVASPSAGEPTNTKVWLFSLEELPGFRHQNRKVIDALSPACSTMPLMLFLQPEGETRTPTGDLFERIPEKGVCSATEGKKLFGLIEKLESLIEKHCDGYFYDNVATDQVVASQAIHDSSTLDEVGRALTKQGVRVERTEFVASYLIAGGLGWLLEPRP